MNHKQQEKNNYLNWLQHFIDQSYDYMALKDQNSKNLYGNKIAAKLLGFKSRETFVGSSDYDIPYGNLAEHSNIFIEQDKRTMELGYLETLEILNYNTKGQSFVLSKKRVERDQSGKILGILCHATLLPNILFNLINHIILQNDIRYLGNKPTLCHYTLVDNDTIFDKHQLPNIIYKCLFYILRGKTAKEIAPLIDRNPRTVEKYFDRLKIHFDCKTKSELIEKTIDLGYLNLIPKEIFNKIMGPHLTPPKPSLVNKKASPSPKAKSNQTKGKS